jgi:4-amino-4-deoxy-L-arabinose transferase-like glycosyltransferase
VTDTGGKRRAPSARSARRPWRIAAGQWELLVLIALGAWLVFRGLGEASFHDEDEALYAAIAGEMLRGGDWALPSFWGEPFLHKPPLGMWLIGAGMGLSPTIPELGARLTSALAWLAVLVLVWVFTHRLAGRIGASTAALLLLTNHQWLYEHAGRSAVFDAELTLWCTLALLAGLTSAGSRWRSWASALAVCAAAMTKAPVALFPALTVLGFLWLSHRAEAWRWLGRLGVAALLVVVPWHVYAVARAGTEFLNVYVLYEILGRAGDTASAHYPGHWVHLRSLWAAWLPWSPGLVALAATGGWALRHATTGNQEGRPGMPAVAPLVGYVVLLLAVLSLTPAKWAWYVLPAHPVLAVLAGITAGRLWRRRILWPLACAAALAAASRLLIWSRSPGYRPAARPSAAWPDESALLEISLHSAVEVAAAAVVTLLTILLALLAARRTDTGARLAVVVLAGVTAAACLADLARVPTAFVHPADALAQRLSREAYQEIRLVGFPDQERYADRMVPIPSFYVQRVDAARVVDEGPPARSVTGTLRGDRRSRGTACVAYSAPAAASHQRGVAACRARWPGAEIWLYHPARGRGFSRLPASAAQTSGSPRR